MDYVASNKGLRLPLAHISALATNHIHLRNPWVTVWWSAAFPGFGHILMGSYVKGFTLIVWEIVVNVQGRINLGILYSLTGRFEMAKAVLDKRWLILYLGVFVYGLYDSYRSTVDINKLSVLGRRSNMTRPPKWYSGSPELSEPNFTDSGQILT